MIAKASTLLLSILIVFSCSAQKKEEKLVRKSFDSYKEAILNDKGVEAVNYVDSRTMADVTPIVRTNLGLI